MRGLDITGQRFGRLLVVKPVYINKTRKWKCACDCGATSYPLSNSLRSGKTVSCGCFHNEDLAKRSTTHGALDTKEYSIWYGMKKRCFVPKHKDFKNYGGRGITVCERWKKSFIHFLEDMGPIPSSKHSIDRINNDGNYEPGNCRWATAKQQNANKRPPKASQACRRGHAWTKENTIMTNNGRRETRRCRACVNARTNTTRQRWSDGWQ